MNAGISKDQNIFDRPHILLDSDHAHLMPEGASDLTVREMVNLFGSSTIGNYIKAQEQKNSPSYRADARIIYQRLKRVRFLWSRLDAHLSDLKKVAYNGEYFRDFVMSAYAFRTLRTDIVEPNLPASLAAAIQSCAEQRKAPEEEYKKSINAIERQIVEELNSSTYPTKNSGNTKKKTQSLAERQAKKDEATKAFEASRALKKVENTLIELSENAHFFKKYKDDPIYPVLEVVETKNSFHVIGKDVGQDELVAHHLSCAKRLLETGLFDRETVIREAVGGVSFERGLKKRKSAIAKANLKKGGSFYQKPKKAGGVYQDYYALVTRKEFDPFISKTLGLALFAAPKDESLDRWTVQDVKDVRDFVTSRYDLVHKVLEGVANRNKNPLGAPLSKEQGVAFLHEALKSSLYPEHRTNIRIGIGGTNVDDIRVRFASYAMNALDIMAVFRRASVETCTGQQSINVPTLSLVSGAAMATKVNGLDKSEAETNQNRMFFFLGRFVETYYPELKEAVSFERPTEREIFDNELFGTVFSEAKKIVSLWDKHQELKKCERELAERGKCVDSNLNSQPIKYISNETPYKQLGMALRQLAKFSQKKNPDISEQEARQRALIYGVAHVMPAVFRSIMPDGKYAGSVWKIGGKSEQYFDQFGEALSTLIQHNTRVSLPNASGAPFLAGLCTTTVVGGNPPPYYKGGEGSFDPGVIEYLNNAGKEDFSDEKLLSIFKESLKYGPDPKTTSERQKLLDSLKAVVGGEEKLPASPDSNVNTLPDAKETERAFQMEVTKKGPSRDIALLLKHRRLGHGNLKRGWQSYKVFLEQFRPA
ncbi:MAG: hypothetical protein PHD48_00585 [Alphaproteobacteria bacterium]|nr:hypothetical protein [Alphaproteobacteria bacterium]